MKTIDGRCRKCEKDGKGTYRMVYACSNCGTKDILVLFSSGHEASTAGPCPVCGVHWWIGSLRLVTLDEILEAP